MITSKDEDYRLIYSFFHSYKEYLKFCKEWTTTCENIKRKSG